MSIESELARIQKAKADMIASIIAKGVDVPENVEIGDLADLILEIGGDSGQTEEIGGIR